MSANENRKTLWERIGMWKFLLVFFIGTGCYFYFFDSDIRFREQIKLSSGEVVLVDRLFETASFGELGGPGGWDAKFNSMVIVEPTDTGVPPIWKSEMGLIPILFDKDTKTKDWYLVATFYSCEAWYQLGRPKLPYAEFRLRSDVWQAVPLTLSLIGRKANVLTTIKNKKELSLHTLETKRQRMSNAKIAKEYNEIVSNWTTGC